MTWYYAEDDQQIGPVSDEEFDYLVENRTIQEDTLVWRPGMEDWQEYGTIKKDFPPSFSSQNAQHIESMDEQEESTGPLLHSAVSYDHSDERDHSLKETEAMHVDTCSECKKPYPVDEMIYFRNRWICPECKQTAVQRVREGLSLKGDLPYAGFWIRFLAKFIDAFILQVANTAIAWVGSMFLMPTLSSGNGHFGMAMLSFSGFVFIPQMIFNGFYYVWFVGKFGATPGKMACKLKIVSPEGGMISYMRALGRWFGEMLSGAILGIGYLMAAFDEEKRTLHDRICSTRVIHANKEW